MSTGDACRKVWRDISGNGPELPQLPDAKRSENSNQPFSDAPHDYAATHRP